LAFWSEFASAFAAQVHSLCASVTAVYLFFFVFGRVLTRLDLESGRYALSGQSAEWALVNGTSRHSLRLFCVLNMGKSSAAIFVPFGA